MNVIKIKSLLCLALCLSACGNGQRPFDATGTFEAVEVTVSSEAAGRILSFDVVEGRQVTAGERLGAIDSVQLHLSRLQLMQQVSSVRSNRPDVRTQIAAIGEQIARQQAERIRVQNLLDAGAATQKQLDDLLASIAVLERQLDAQQSALRNSVSSLDAQSSALEIQIAQLEDRLAKCVIASPVDGTVLAKYTAAGELSVIGKPLFKVADLRRMFLRAYLTSGQLADVRLGQEVRVFADFGGDRRREYRGVIAWISDKSEFTPKSIQTRTDRENLVYAVKIAVENDGYIKIGMYGETKFSFSE
ncbi:MAG: HlyD family efflux transporter periplasmic adaptor subunit [Tannerella sp.]|jgi:HlyD family secretion protein|nr:HlyD family efflux transporter periplasmic adaptor subunit [Tannerella sp.]